MRQIKFSAPDPLFDLLTAKAAAAGISLSEFIRRNLSYQFEPLTQRRQVMALTVTKKAIEDGMGVVWIESEDLQELVAPPARKLAYEQRTAMGISDAGLDTQETQALDNDGKVIDDGDPTVSPARYRRIFHLIVPPI